MECRPMCWGALIVLLLSCFSVAFGDKGGVSSVPKRYAFTRSKSLKLLVIRVEFPGDDRPKIPLNGYVEDFVMDAVTYYNDSSWGKQIYTPTFTDVLRLKTNKWNSTSSTIMDEAIEAAGQAGFVYCTSPCSLTGQTGFDQLIVVHYGSPPASTSSYAGLASPGTGKSWARYYHINARVLTHEIAHCLGVHHEGTWKRRGKGEDKIYNTVARGMYSVLGWGRPKGRYSNNAHLSLAQKVYFGWIKQENIVYMHPKGNASAGCPQCVAIFEGEINAFDRPDVVPKTDSKSSRSGSKYMGVSIWYDQGNELYIQFRSGHEYSRKGITVEYCHRYIDGSYSGGGTSKCYQNDANGATKSMSDAAILPGTSYVITPPDIANMRAFDLMNQYFAVVEVDSISNFANCLHSTCPADVDISAKIKVRFIGKGEQFPISPAVHVSSAKAITNKEFETTRSTSGENVVVMHAVDTPGAGTDGVLELIAGPMRAPKASFFFYDSYPWSSLKYASPHHYQSIKSIQRQATELCTPGTKVSTFGGARAVVVRQMATNQNLEIVELEIYKRGDPTTNVAAESICYNMPRRSHYYTGDLDWIETLVTDGDFSYSSMSYSQYALLDTDERAFVMCVFDQALDIETITVYPKQSNWGQSDHLNVQVYAYGEVLDNGGGSPAGLLYEKRIGSFNSWSETNKKWFESVQVPKALADHVECKNSKTAFSFPSRNGETFVVGVLPKNSAQSAGINVEYAALKMKSCPAGTYVENLAGGLSACRRCPKFALDVQDKTLPKVCSRYVNQCTYLELPDGVYKADLSSSPPIYTTKDGSRKLVFSGLKWSKTGQHSNSKEQWSTLKTSKVKAVKIAMNQAEWIEIAEFRMYQESDSQNIMTKAKCFNFPKDSKETWYTGDRSTGEDKTLNDGDILTYATSGPWGKSVYMICLFPEEVSITKFAVAPKPGSEFRSSKLVVSLYSTYQVPPEGEEHVQLQNLVYTQEYDGSKSQVSGMCRESDLHRFETGEEDTFEDIDIDLYESS